MLSHKRLAPRNHSSRLKNYHPMVLQMICCLGNSDLLMELIQTLGMLVMVPYATAQSAANTAVASNKPTSSEEIQCPCGKSEVQMDEKNVVKTMRVVCSDETGSNVPKRKGNYKLSSPEYCFYTVSFEACQDRSKCGFLTNAVNKPGAQFYASTIEQLYNDDYAKFKFDGIATLKDKNNFVEFSSMHYSKAITVNIRCTKENCEQLFSEGVEAFTNKTLYNVDGSLFKVNGQEDEALLDFFFEKMKELEDLRIIRPPRSLPTDPFYTESIAKMSPPDPGLVNASTACLKPVQCVCENYNIMGFDPSAFLKKQAKGQESNSCTKVLWWWLLVLALLWQHCF